MSNKIIMYIYVTFLGLILIHSLHAQERYIYWTDFHSMYRGVADGSYYEPIIISDAKIPFDVKIGNLYFKDNNNNSIKFQSLNSDSSETILTSVLDVEKIIAEPVNQKIYWSESGEGKIRCVSMDGTGITDLVIGISKLQDFVVDVIGGHIYWVSQSGWKIKRAKLNGLEIEDVITVGSRVTAINVDALRGKIYWADNVSNPQPTIKRANLDGSEIETILTGYTPLSILIDLENGKIYLDSYERIIRINFNGSDLEVLVSGFKLGISNFRLDLCESKMYWKNSESNIINRANINGSGVEDVIITIHNIKSVAVDTKNKYIYWISYTNIYRSDFDGTNIKYIGNVTNGVYELSYIALDTENEMIYWILDSDWISMKIGRTHLETMDIDYSLSSVSTWPFSLTVDPSKNILYWIDRRSIYRLNLSNNERETVIGDLHEHGPYDLALDLKNQKVYWTEGADSGAIYRCSLDGSNIETILSNLDRPSGIALDVAGGKIYWTESKIGKIKRANLDGTEIEEIYTGLSAPYRIALSFENNGWTAVEKRDNLTGLIPTHYALYHSYPNPFNPQTTISYALPKDCYVTLTIYNMLGQEVRTLVNEFQVGGSKWIVWDGKDNLGESVPSGVYVYQISAAEFTQSRKLLLLK
jgi:hypothetical protein